MTPRSFSVLLAMAASFMAVCAHAQNPDPTDIRACTGIEGDAQRLACYDHSTGRVNLPAAQKRADKSAATPAIFRSGAAPSTSSSTQPNNEVDKPLSLLDSRWELAPETHLGTLNLRGYRPMYIMPLFVTSRQNKRPESPNPTNSAGANEQLENAEAKFQLSIKTKVWQGVFGDVGDLWVGYTQSSRWQVYDSKLSRPFRETNYEPEAMLVFNTNYHIFGWDGRLLGISAVHQSNGRSDPLSRSWNRVVGSIGLERGDWVVMVRPWWRIPETKGDDNNPDISDYMGRGEVQIVHEWRGQEFGMLLRHSMRGGARSHGSARFTWSFPLVGNVRGYTELFNGYGESLIDYNHHATYAGVGISLLDWY